MRLMRALETLQFETMWVVSNFQVANKKKQLVLKKIFFTIFFRNIANYIIHLNFFSIHFLLQTVEIQHKLLEISQIYSNIKKKQVYKNIILSSGQTLGVKAQRFRGHTSPHRNVKEKIHKLFYFFYQI
eukprot:TRINITY_DN26203_c1_g1_i1.p1 TRINITY_DN26203_c1_g1~~TRINITY_DN26203_c1_g1_i1.p1  ORF type:complete len:128 (-),score=9.07 TRINITY_DN26203_c1_g1_i1:99-482(-)